MTRNTLFAACLALCVPLTGTAADRLNVKTGLWEITSVTQMAGVLPLPKELKDKLSPEQRAKMAADMRAEAAEKPGRDTSKECVTEKDLEHPFDSADVKNCRQSMVTTTRTSQEVRLVCTGEHKGSGLLKISTPTPESMNGTIDLKMGEGAEVFTLKATLSGRWLGADCGDEAENDDDVDSDDEPADDNEEEEE